jgi:hypothetical protein
MANTLNPPPSTEVVKRDRFGRNGTRDLSPLYSTGDHQSARPRWAVGVARFWDKHLPSLPNPFKAKPRGDGFDDDDNGVYGITQKTDFWFNRELLQVEQEAKQLAADWAEKGLPRHDVERVGVLEPEQVLAMKSLELFRQWRKRVQITMQDQIQTRSSALNRMIGDSRSEVNALEATATERRNTQTQIDSLQGYKEIDPSRVGYDRIFKSTFGFWVFAVILTMAEFTANFPVFRLLLPMNSTLVSLASTLGEAAEAHTWLAGPLVLFQDILLHFEAFLVALIAVVILVLL